MSMMDMFGMLGKAKEVQSRIQKFKEDAVKITVVGEAGGGLVKVTVNGKKHTVAISIDPSLLKTEDATILQDFIIAATNKAIIEMEGVLKVELQKQTEGLIPNIPGFDLGQLINS